MLPIGFAVAWPLWLLVGLPLLWLLAWKHRGGLSRRRLAWASLLRSAALVLVCLALMGPSLRKDVHDISVVYALDISRSISPAFLNQALDWIDQANARHKPDLVRYMVFADKAKLLYSSGEIGAVEVRAQSSANEPAVRDVIDQSATNLENALATAMFGFGPEHAKRLVLISDGNQTEGDLWQALPRLRAENIRVFTFPATVAVNHDAWIEELAVPEGVRQQEPVGIQVRVFSRSATGARIELKTAGGTLGTRTVRLLPGENQFSFSTRFEQRGAIDLFARVSAQGDQVTQNDGLTETVWVGPRPRILYVDGSPENSHYLADALTRQGLDVEVADAGRLASEPGLLAGKDSVILSDIRAQSIDIATGDRLEAFVRDQGGGLIFAAGENTYGKDGFSRSALERLLPVRFEAPRKRKELDLVLLIDRSHSMRGRKLELAKSAALASLDLLDKDHRLAVVAFDSLPHDVVPLARVGSKRRAEDLIRSMTSSGQTNIYNGLAHALRLLEGSSAKTKHVILLSDGNSAPPSGNTEKSSSELAMEIIRRGREGAAAATQGPANVAPGGYPGLLEKLVAEKITLTTVALGENPNLELMTQLAESAEGKYYVAEQDSEIPRLFVAETRRLVGQSIVEEPFLPIIRGRAASIAGVDFATAPRLKGYVIGKTKQFSDVLLEAKNNQPLLVETHYGLGKTVAFLSDVKNRWSADWIDWAGYGQLWGQVVRDSLRRDAGTHSRWRVIRQGREAVLVLRLFEPDGAYRNGLSPKARITGPDGRTDIEPLRQIAPGEYRARVQLDASRAAPYRFELLDGPGLTKRDLAHAGTRRLFIPYPDEYRVLPANLELLKAIGASTGGGFAPKIEEIFAAHGDGGMVTQPLWQLFALGALVIFLIEIVVRRAPWPRD